MTLKGSQVQASARSENADFDSSVGGSAVLNANSSAGTKGQAGSITVKASHKATIEDGASLTATAGHGGSIEFSGADVMMGGTMDVHGKDNTTGGTITIDPTNIVINNGGSDGILNHVSEDFIESQSLGGTNVVLVAAHSVIMNDLTDNELTGGNGDITLRTTDKKNSFISFNDPKNGIHTTGGDIVLDAGTGGVNVGNLSTGLRDFTGYVLEQPDGDIQAGSIKIRSRGDITTRELTAYGTSGDTRIDLEAGNDINVRSIAVKIIDYPQPGGNGHATIDLDASGNITVTKGIEANAADVEGATQQSLSHIEIFSKKDITVGGKILATSVGGVSKPGNDSYSDASIFITGKTVNLQHTEANAAFGDQSRADVTINADVLNSTYDIRSLAAKNAGSSGKVKGNITINAPITNVQVPDQIGEFRATTDVVVNGKIDVRTPEDITLDGGAFDLLDSTRSFKLRGGNSVTVTGDITSAVADVYAIAGAGGIQLANVTTGDASKVDSLTLYQGGGKGSVNGAFKPRQHLPFDHERPATSTAAT